MSDEIDEFIRRAAERRKQQGQGQRRPKPTPPPAAPVQRERPRPRLAAEVIEAEIVSAEVVEDIAQSVSKNLDTREFEQRATHFSDQAALSDTRTEARLHQAFDHQLGRLSQTSSTEMGGLPTIRSATDVAAQVTTGDANQMLTFLLNSLRDQRRVREAFILSEILVRPEHRW